MRRVCAFVAAAGALLLPDVMRLRTGVYHSEASATGRSRERTARGGVRRETSHPNGTQIFAHEIYSLKGALPNTTYQVFLLVHLGDPGCDNSTATNFGSTDLTTNATGNGRADRFIPTETVPLAIRDQTHGVRWEVRLLDGTLVYQSACTNVTLD